MHIQHFNYSRYQVNRKCFTHEITPPSYSGLWLCRSSFSFNILLDASKLLPYTLTQSKEGEASSPHGGVRGWRTRRMWGGIRRPGRGLRSLNIHVEEERSALPRLPAAPHCIIPDS